MANGTPAPIDRAALERIIQRAAELQTSEREIGEGLTTDQVMDRLLAEPLLRRKAVSCVLGAVKCGSEWRFRRSDLENWIARQLAPEVPNVPPPPQASQ